MRWVVGLVGGLAASLLDPARAAAQADIVQKGIDRISTEAPLIVVVILVVVAAYQWIIWKKDTAHQASMKEATDRAVGLVEKTSDVTERLAVALERLRDALVEDREDAAEYRGEFRKAVEASVATQAEIRAAVIELRDAHRARGAQAGRVANDER